MNTSQNSSSNPFMRNPLFAAAAAYALGVYCYNGINTDPRFLIFAFVITLLVSVADSRARTLCVFVALVCAGYVSALAADSQVSKTSIAALYDKGWVASGDPVELEAVLTDHPQQTVDGVFLTVAAKTLIYKREHISTSGIVRVFVPLVSPSDRTCVIPELSAGNTVKISTRLKREEQFRNPGSNSNIESLERRGLSATGSVKSCLLIEATDRAVTFFAPAYVFREWLTKRILDTHDRRTAGIVLASLIGNRNFLTKESGETFRESGTFHVLVISGLHITLIGGLILLIVRKFTGNRLSQFVTANVLLWSYAVVVGLQLPVLRAAVMYTVFLLSYAVYRRGTPLNGLGAAALLILVWRPSDLFNLSFQLTFLSIFSIIVFAFPIIENVRSIGLWMPTPQHPFPPHASRPLRLFAEALYWSEKRWQIHLAKQSWKCSIEKTYTGLLFADSFVQKCARNLFQVAAVTISVQMFMLPLLVLNFHRIGAAAVFSNIFAGIAIAVQNIAAITSIAISTIDIESARAFSYSMSFINGASQFLQQTLSGNVFTPARIPIYSGAAKIVYLIYFIPLTILSLFSAFWDPFAAKKAAYFKKIAFAAAFLVVALASVIAFHPYSEPTTDGRLTVDFLDVGQGDSALVTFPDGSTLLIDGGGQRKSDNGENEAFEADRAGIGEKVVSEFLWEKGYSSIDFVVSTHPDADHIEGLTDVIRNFDVRSVFVGGNFDEVAEFAEMRAVSDKKGIPIEIVNEGLVLQIGGARVTVLNPRRGESAEPENDDSIVLSISFGSRTFLFTGDIENESENRLLSLRRRLAADVIKVAHHGSRTSSIARFVDQVRPSYAVIPVGKRSPFGHPHSEVVERWKAAGARVLETGDGTITISTDGSDLRVLTW